jgi:hypothetical protein
VKYRNTGSQFHLKRGGWGGVGWGRTGQVPYKLEQGSADCSPLRLCAYWCQLSAKQIEHRGCEYTGVTPQTIGSTATSACDLLLLSHPDEMERELQELANKTEGTGVERSFGIRQRVALRKDRPTYNATGNVLQWTDGSQPTPPTEPLGIDVPQNGLVTEPILIQPAEVKAKPSKNWLQRWLSPDPPDPRRATREPLSWLAVYFFTGGNPVAQGIRDISVTGLYVITTERWYLGTVIRLTLIDRQQPTPDRSFTVNAKVVRAGEDGLGFQFIFDVENRFIPGKPVAGGLSACENRMQIEEFLRRVKGSSS